MSVRRLLLAFPVALALAACASDEDDCVGCPPGSQLQGRLYVVNGARDLGNLQVWVDSQLVWNRVEPRSSTGTVWLRPGEHTVAIVRSTAPSFDDEFNVVVRADQPRLIVALNQGGDVSPMVVGDTGAIVPDGATKLRVVHGAQGAPAVDIWRSQPDFPTHLRVMTPFTQGATSPYLQSTSGTWTVTVTAHDPAATAPGAALATGSIALASGERASAVLVSGRTAGTVELVMVREH